MFYKLRTGVTWLLMAVSLSGCGGMALQDFAASPPDMRLEEYFSGRTKAWGLFEDRFGNVRRQFVVDLVGRWDGRELVLEEDFLYDDGERDRRVWTIVKLADGTYEGRADDVIGVAKGAAAGRAFNWRYSVDLKTDDGPVRVQFDDWLFRQDAEVVLNKAEITKYGLQLGQVFLSFRKLPN